MQAREHQQLVQQYLVILAQRALEALERGLFFLPGLGDGCDRASHFASLKELQLYFLSVW